MLVSFAQFLGVHVEEISKTRTCQSSYCSKFDGNVCVHKFQLIFSFLLVVCSMYRYMYKLVFFFRNVAGTGAVRACTAHSPRRPISSFSHILLSRTCETRYKSPTFAFDMIQSTSRKSDL